jgi:riboflavin transporter FmnP
MSNPFIHLLIEIFIWTAKKSMQIVMKVENDQTNYTQIPKYILSENKLRLSIYFFQVIPAVVLAVLAVNTYLPPYFPFIEKALDKNSGIIPILMLGIYPFILIIIGFITEQLMLLLIPKYRKYKMEQELF